METRKTFDKLEAMVSEIGEGCEQLQQLEARGETPKQIHAQLQKAQTQEAALTRTENTIRAIDVPAKEQELSRG